MLIPIRIPTRKFLKDFLVRHFELTKPSFEKGSEEYRFLRSLLTKPKVETRPDFFDDFIELKVPDYCFERKINYVNNTNANRFYLHYLKLFNNEFYFEVDKMLAVAEQMDQPLPINQAILSFAARFGWDEGDIKFETLKKAYYRARNEEKKQSFFVIEKGTVPARVPDRVLLLL